GTLATTAVSAWLGAQVYRVHEVAETLQVLDMVASIAGHRPPAVARRGLAKGRSRRPTAGRRWAALTSAAGTGAHGARRVTAGRSGAALAPLRQARLLRDQGHRLLHVVRDVEQHQVLLRRLALGDDRVAEPVDQAAPVLGAEEDDGEAGDLLGLDEGEGLEQLVQGAEAAGQHDEALGVLDEHQLADEEVAEVQADVDVGVQPLLEGELDAEADRDAVRLQGALVGRLHGPGATPGDHREARLDQAAAQLDAGLVLPGVLGGARRAEDADGGRELGQGAEALDDLRRHAQHAPGVGVDPAAGGALVQQPLVGGARLHLVPPAEHRTETLLLGRLLWALRLASDHARSLRVPGCSTSA